MKRIRRAIELMVAGLAFSLLIYQLATVQALPAQPEIVFNDFNSTYHLSRDANGNSLLTTQEVILADFGSSGFYGITRSIPKTYQGHSVNVKVFNVTDAAGTDIPFKTSNSGGNLIVTTGDPSISLYGPQTIKINYQTSGVIDLGQKTDEFLLDVNGRGWSQPIGEVEAALYLPSNLVASLNGQPTCYLALNQSSSNNCQISSQKTAQNTVVITKTGQVVAHQTLVIKTDFKTATFTNSQSHWGWWIFGGIAFITLTAGSSYLLKKRFASP